MIFLAFALDSSGCIKRIRSIWLRIFLVIFEFNFFIRKVFDADSFIIYIGLGAVQIFDLYIMYLFISAKVNCISLKNSE